MTTQVSKKRRQLAKKVLGKKLGATKKMGRRPGHQKVMHILAAYRKSLTTPVGTALDDSVVANLILDAVEGA